MKVNPYNTLPYLKIEDAEKYLEISEAEAKYVHKSGDETISGTKTFTQRIISSKAMNVTVGNLTVTNLADGQSTDGVLAINSETNKRCGSLRLTNGDGYNDVSLTAANETGDINQLGIRNTNGVAYGYAPTYTSNYADNSTKIVTTAYMANHWTTTKATTSSTASKARPAVVIQNYVNGNSWYRVWSDGWIEQGGYQSFSDYWTLTFLKPFTKTNYTFTSSSEGEDLNAVLGITSRTAKSIGGNSADKRTLTYNWRASGY